MESGTGRRRALSARTLAKVAACAVATALIPCAVPAAELVLAGPGAAFAAAGLDDGAAVRGTPWALANGTAADSRYAPLADWTALRSVEDGLLEVRATVEGGASNAVWIAFGPPDAPALRIGWERGRWRVLGGDGAPGAFEEPPDPPPAAGRRSIAVALRTGTGLGDGWTSARVREGDGPWMPAPPDLDLGRTGWTDPSQLPSAWDAARVSLRGEGAALAELSLRWASDPSLLLVR